VHEEGRAEICIKCELDSSWEERKKFFSKKYKKSFYIKIEIHEVILYRNRNIRENGMQICWYFGKYLVGKGLEYLFDGELV